MQNILLKIASRMWYIVVCPGFIVLALADPTDPPRPPQRTFSGTSVGEAATFRFHIQCPLGTEHERCSGVVMLANDPQPIPVTGHAVLERYRIVLQITLDGDSIQCTLVEMLPKSKPWGKPLRYRTMDSSCTFPFGSGVARDVSMSFERGSNSFSLPRVPSH